MSKVLITSALPYVNNIPHLGNLIGAVLSADVYARHKRLQGHEVLYVCGADEHGSATEKKAKEEGVTEQELCDTYGKIHKEIYDYFNISFDVWGRTHTQQQIEIVQELFVQLDENGYIFEEEVEQLYDEQAQTFLADRFVEGECPHCGADGARGDQCDTCQKLINAVELKNPKSMITQTTPVIKSTKHLFLDLPKLAPIVEEWMGERPDWSENAINFTKDYLKNLKARAITRDLKWGVPVPKEGFENKVFYVWFDAPIGYISITKAGRDDWKDWWHNPDNTLAQFMGKDNTIFHSIIFPAVLLGSKQPYNKLDQLSVTEYLNLKDSKFSKSQHTGIFGNDVKEIEQQHNIPVDVWRYALLANRPETSDTNFSFEELQRRLNTELVDNLGNLIHRTLHFAYTKTKDIPTKTATVQIDTDYTKIIDHLDKRELRQALKEILKKAKEANQAFQHAQPWKSIKEQPGVAAADILELTKVIRDISILAAPYMPTIAEQIHEMLGLQHQTYADIGTSLTLNELKQPTILFEKLEDETVHKLTMTYTPPQHQLNLKVAEILDVKEHPNADRLYLANIDLGDEQRQLVAGLKEHYTPEELVGKHAIVITNLKPAKIRGETSQGMLLASENENGVVGLLQAPDATPGTQITIPESIPASKPLDFNEFQKLEITSTKDAVTVDDKPLQGAAITVDKDAYGKVR